MVSIIIVNYHVEKELIDCLNSIYKSKTKTLFEVLVVDNDEKKTIKEHLLKKFPKIKYIPNENKGFGQANNVGASKAKGEYLFILNPDTRIYPHAIDSLINFLKNNKDTAIVAPLLLDIKGKPYAQGTEELTPVRGIFALSFLNQIFPNNPISKKYTLKNWNKKSKKEVGVIPGTAFVVSKKMFRSVGGFDEHFFLYFEEFDLCKRLKNLGYKLFIIPEAKVMHHWGASTKKRSDIQKIFNRSRFYYFRKNYGLLAALFTESILRFNKYTALLLGTIILGAFLRFYNIHETMHFIGDQGWYYISAREFILNGNFPLVGIASSHPWLHQGAYWTYLLIPIFSIFGFNPFNGAYVSIFIDIMGIIAVYIFGKTFFSQRTGTLASILYAASPFIIFNARAPYHTSPVPFVTILALFALFKWINGQKYFFPVFVFFLAVLYNFVLVSFLLSITTLIILLYGFIKKQKWAKDIFDRSVLLLSIAAYILPMLPMLIYDVSHKFPQTLKFVAWIGYRILVFFGYPQVNHISEVSTIDMFIYFSNFLSQLILPHANAIALITSIVSVLYLFILLLKKKLSKNSVLLLSITIFLLTGVFFSKTPSGAYLPILVPGIILLVAVFFDSIMNQKILRYFVPILIVVSVLSNGYYVLVNQYSAKDDQGTISNRIALAKSIVNESAGKEYNLKVVVNGDNNVNFSKNYEYLTWWLGNGPSASAKPIQFTILETNGKVEVVKEEK